MRHLSLILAAAALTLPCVDMVAPAPAMAKYVAHQRVYKTCRHSKGKAGLIAGGVAGAVIGGSLIGGGLAGPLIGAAGGALGGRAIDRSITAKKRCHYYTRR